jgi:hypothetical protein
MKSSLLKNIPNMKKLKTIAILSLILVVISGCKEENLYSGIVFKNYLTFQIEQSSLFLTTVYEGDQEGEYESGSIQIYQQKIDEALVINENPNSSQDEIDKAYEMLLTADKDFSDVMVPYRSAFQPLIDYGQFVHDNTIEGTGEGEATSGSKEILNGAITEARTNINDPDLTQNELDLATEELESAIYAFNTGISGAAKIIVNNYSFEQPGYETDGFDEVPGWSPFGSVEDWAPNPGVILNDSTTDGDYAARIGSYTTGIYQSLNELVNPVSQYTLKADISLLRNDGDWENKIHPVVIRARIITFNQTPGDYNFISILSETIDTLGRYPTSYKELELDIDIDAISPDIGKRMGIDFILRHTFDPENPIYAESYLSIDNVRVSRKTD